MKQKIYQSIKFKLAIVVTLICLVLAVSVNYYTITNTKKVYKERSENYLYDLAISYGMVVDDLLASGTKETVLTAENMKKHLEDVGIRGDASSYAYMVDNQGMMLYHPTPEKIGQKVENEVVTKLVKELAKGNVTKPSIIEYPYKGVVKYAAHYTNAAGDYILVITAGEAEVIAPFTAVTKSATIIAFMISILAIAGMVVLLNVLLKPLVIAVKLIDNLGELNFSAVHFGKEEKYIKKKDEMGRIFQSVLLLRQKLTDVIEQLRNQSDELFRVSDILSQSAKETEETVGHIESAIGEISEGATSQADETQLATESVIAMGNMVVSANGNVNTLKGNADKMETLGYTASDTLNQLKQVNEKVEVCIKDIREQTNITNESVIQISNAVQVITSIADETSLLSLNANIEAARAGEMGKGFAVVASQIQKLAEQSNTSAMEIEEVIANVMENSNRVVETMNQVSEIVTTQSAQMEQTYVIFKDVLEGIVQSKDGIDSIAMNTQEMDKSREKVVDVVQSLSAIAEQNAASAEETSASIMEVATVIDEVASDAEKMRGVAQKLKDSVDLFQLN